VVVGHWFAFFCSFSVVLALTLLELCGVAYPTPQGEDGNLSQTSALIESGNYREAEAIVRRVLAANPTYIAGHRMLALVYQRQEDYRKAEEELQATLKLAGESDPQLLFQFCQVEFALKKTGQVLTLVRRIYELAGKDVQTRYEVGHWLRENSLLVEALQELGEAHALAPENPAVTTELIIACEQGGRVAEAEALLLSLLKKGAYGDLVQAGSRFGEARQFSLASRAFQRALEVQPDSFDAEFDLAFAQFHQGDYTKAMETLDKISPVQSEGQADYNYLRGKLELGLGRTQAAGEQFLLALQEQPNNESVCVDAGLLFFRFENLWKALEVFQSCVGQLPDSVPVETGLGLTYLRLGKYPDAVTTFQRVVTLQPEADGAREALVFLLYITGNVEQARQVVEERLASGNDVDFYIEFLYALVLLRQDSRAHQGLAFHSLEQSLSLNPKFAPAYFQRGKIEFEAGERQQALADLEVATRLDPAYAQPYYVMAQIYFKLGKAAQADQARVKFAKLNREHEEKQQEREVENHLVQALQ
jgi:tetratricopeptide (TPR) repeat protein